MTNTMRSIWPVITCFVLAGCHGLGHRAAPPPHTQDSFRVRGNIAARSMPDALPQTRMPQIDGRADSPAAYRAPAMPSFADRPLQENIESSIELADYAQALRQAGVMPWLNSDGPYTVFALPNAGLEKLVGQWGGGVSTPANQARLKDVVRYTIVPGRWDETALRKALRRARTPTLGLKTVSGRWIYVQPTPDGSFAVSNGRSPAVRLWGTSFPQSNGVLYFLHDAVTP